MNKAISSKTTVGLITPSSPLFPGRLQKSIAYFESNGFKVKVGKHNNKTERFLAGTDEERASDIMDFFKDSDVDLIIVTGGGAGSIRVLPLLDFELIKKNPKPLIGFSDTTSLQLGLYSKTGMTTYTGFTCKDVAEEDSLNDTIKRSLNHCIRQENYSIQEGASVNTGKAMGPLVGGNLMCLTHLLGTPFQPDFKGKILFFEEVVTEPYVLDGMMSQLYLSGILNQVSGVIIGQFKGCDAKYFPDRDGNADDVINDWSRKLKVPCIKNVPYGHYDRRYVLPIGQNAILDADNCKIDIIFDSGS
jgi:muramoyltetrapeptide carboxypeptidase